MKEKSTWDRIPAEQASSAVPWMLPTIGKNSKVLPSFEKEERERKAVERQSRNESISIVEVDPHSLASSQGPTAEELEQIVSSAEKEGFAKGYQEGATKGRSEGYEEGRMQAYAEFKAQLIDEQLRFRKLADALESPLAQQTDALEAMIVKSIALMTQSVVTRELQLDRTHLIGFANHAIEALPVGYQQLKLLINPKDVDLLENYIADNNLSWVLQPDASITEGGLRIETLESRIDQTVETRLKQVLQQFLTKQLSTLTPPEAAIEEDVDDFMFTAEEQESPLSAFGLDDVNLASRAQSNE